MDFLPLEAVFDTAGAIAWAAIVSFVAELVKRLTPFPTTGRGPMYLVALLSAAIVGLALVDGVSPGAALGSSVIASVLAWANVTAAAIGTHQVITKTARVIAGDTNPSGPDDDAARP